MTDWKDPGSSVGAGEYRHRIQIRNADSSAATDCWAIIEIVDSARGGNATIRARTPKVPADGVIVFKDRQVSVQRVISTTNRECICLARAAPK